MKTFQHGSLSMWMTWLNRSYNIFQRCVWSINVCFLMHIFNRVKSVISLGTLPNSQVGHILRSDP